MASEGVFLGATIMIAYMLYQRKKDEKRLKETLEQLEKKIGNYKNQVMKDWMINFFIFAFKSSKKLA